MTMEKERTYTHLGYTINVYHDNDSESPSKWGDEDRRLVFEHRDLTVKTEQFNAREIFEDGGIVKGYHVFGCAAYIHSGIVLSVGNGNHFPDRQWDVSTTGYWLIKREKGSWTREQARKAAEALCRTWNQYLSGEIYGYKVESSDGHHIDSCWGYYGDDDKSGLLESAKEAIECNISAKVREHVQQVKQWILNKVPIIYRKPLVI